MQLTNLLLLTLSSLPLTQADDLPHDCFQIVTVTKNFEGLSPTTLLNGDKTYVTTAINIVAQSVSVCEQFLEEEGLVTTKYITVPSETIYSTVTSCHELNGVAKRDCLAGKTTLATSTN
ncbi:hypothetical protein DAPK24_020390 [Pichia kluyveri]|uniref:Uncharacterized protein n=1 Tax=Pichia kluyveri TaxID=36015 RepID=A0AAV5R209_PICKL|nr:hypothetical protein DAPK24_020390 [Pichia kluyveri]